MKNKIFKEANKIWPAKYAIPILITFFVLSTLIIVVSYFLDKEGNKNEYISFQIKGRIEKRIATKNYVFCKINSDWYGVQGEINLYLSENDKLNKESGSSELTVTKGNGKTKNYDFPYTYFSLVHDNKKLSKYFKTLKIIPDSLGKTMKKYNEE